MEDMTDTTHSYQIACPTELSLQLTREWTVICNTSERLWHSNCTAKVAKNIANFHESQSNTKLIKRKPNKITIANGLGNQIDKKKKRRKMGHTLMHKLPVQMMCWILPGTSMDLNLAGRSGALCGTCRSPNANTNTIFLVLHQQIRYSLSNHNDDDQIKGQKRKKKS